MIPSAKRLQFVVAFVKAKPGELRGFRQGIQTFLLGGAQPLSATGILAIESADGTMSAFPPYTGTAPEDLSVEELAQLQLEVLRVLRPLAQHNRRPPLLAREGPPTITVGPVDYSVLTPMESGGALLPGGRALLALWRLSVRDAFLWILADLLRQEPIGRIRECPEAACGHEVFFRIGKRLYCSQRCIWRANQRARRAPKPKTDAWKKREKARKRRQYERRIAQRRTT